MNWWSHINWTAIAIAVSMFVGAIFTLIIIVLKVVGLT